MPINCYFENSKNKCSEKDVSIELEVVHMKWGLEATTVVIYGRQRCALFGAGGDLMCGI